MKIKYLKRSADENNIIYDKHHKLISRVIDNNIYLSLLKRINLTPYKLTTITSPYEKKGVTYFNKWYDDNKCLFFIKDKKPYIQYNVLEIPLKKTDLYNNININEAILISKLIYVITSLENKYILLLGEDDNYRSYMLDEIDNKYIRISNLMLGLDILCYIESRSGERIKWEEEIISNTYFEKNTNHKICYVSNEEIGKIL